MRLSFATAFLAAVAASPLCAAAPMMEPEGTSSDVVGAVVDAVNTTPDVVGAVVDAVNTTPDVVGAVVDAVNTTPDVVPVAAAAVAVTIPVVAAAAADGSPSVFRKIPGAVRSSWNYAAGTVKTGARQAKDYVVKDPLLRRVPGAVKSLWNYAAGGVRSGWIEATGGVRSGWNVATGTVKTGARQAKDYVVKHPEVVAGLAGVGGAVYAAHRYVPYLIERLRRPELVSVRRCRMEFTVDADCPPPYEGDDDADAYAIADDLSDPSAKAALEALSRRKLSGTITATTVVRPVGVAVRIPE